MAAISVFNAGVIFSSAVGLILSLYSLYVEIKKDNDADYVALCDISEHMSCSKAFTSDYGKGFGLIQHVVGKESIFNLPNPVIGIPFYGLLIALAMSSSLITVRLQLMLCVLSNIGSIYLGYVLYFILHDLCVVCVSIYVVNLINLILTLVKYRRLKQNYRKKTKSK